MNGRPPVPLDVFLYVNIVVMQIYIYKCCHACVSALAVTSVT